MNSSNTASPWQGSLRLTVLDEPTNPRQVSTSKIRNSIVVFSGGSAANNLVDVFNGLREANTSALSYVLPISDNGGSSSELIRVFGGPGECARDTTPQGSLRTKASRRPLIYCCLGIGDVRSRLVRLIPNDGPETLAIKQFFNHRLPENYGPARAEWLDIVEATHPLWQGISSPKKELIRSFLNAMHLEIVKRMRPSSRFDFSKASIGNLFLTGYDFLTLLATKMKRSLTRSQCRARLFTGSFEAAIYLLSSICSVPASISVLPALNTNFAHHIAAELAASAHASFTCRMAMLTLPRMAR